MLPFHSSAVDDDTNSSKTMVYKKKNRLAAAFGCSCCIFILGIVCIVLKLRGYFTFKEPTIGQPFVIVESFGVNIPTDGNIIPTDGNITWSDGLDIFEGLTTDVNAPPVIALKLITEFMNPNTYDISIEQSEEEGTILIPACVIKNEASNCANLEDMTIPAESPDDLMIGKWELPVTILEAKSSTNITVPINANIDDLSGDGVTFLLSLFKWGGPLVIRIQGGMKASSWLPALSGSASFDCLAEWKDITNPAEVPLVKCNFNVMNMIPIEDVVIPV